MTSVGKWSLSGVGITSILTTELDGLTSGSMSAASSAFDNGTNLDIYVDIELVLGSLSPAAGSYVSLYMEETVDGTNYPGQSAADLRLTTTQLLCVIPTGTAAATGQRIVVRNVVIPPAKFKVLLDNQTGVNLAANSNTVKFLPYNVNLNG